MSALLDWARSVFAYGKRIATLETRVSALEADLHGKHPPEVCESCGARGMRRVIAFEPEVSYGGVNPRRKETWTCRECGQSEDRIVTF